MTNWRDIPFLQYGVDQPEEGEISSGLKKIVLSLNLAVEKTFKGSKYKKFAILFTTFNEINEYVFDIMCHEVEFMANFKKFVEGVHSKKDAETILEGIWYPKFSKLIARVPVGKFMAATIVYDEQVGKITLGEEPLQMDVTTTSGLLFLLSSMSNNPIMIDSNGLIFEYYNLRKLVFYNMDTGKIDFSKLKINVDNYEEWDYYYPEYDREVEENKKRYKEIIEKELPEELFESKQIKLPKNEDQFLEIIDEIITDFKNMVENKGYRLLLYDNGKPRHEELCQILFDVYLKNYCRSVGIDLTREVQTGRGHIDFRFSSDVHFIAHVELKKEDNPKLTHGLSKQLPTYMISEKVKLGFFVIFEFGMKDISGLKDKLEKQRIELEREKEIKLRIIYINAQSKPSASST